MSNYVTDAKNYAENYLRQHNIPTYFYLCLFGELVKVWGIDMLKPDPYYDAEYDEDGNMIDYSNDKYAYKDQIDCFLAFNTGTSGWDVAFKESCIQCALNDLWDDYNNLSWVYSDIFDGYIADKMLNVLFDGEQHNDYYMFKI